MPAINLKQFEVWFITGSQHLYGAETLREVGRHSQEVAKALDAVAADSRAGRLQAGADDAGADSRRRPRGQRGAELHRPRRVDAHLLARRRCGSPGCKLLQKPLLHLHTQFNRDLPWSTIDMDFMNMNQSAHGDREFGFIGARMRLPRKVVVGHWQDDDVQQRRRRLDPRRRGPARCPHRHASPASATTCARSPSPKATRSPPRSASATR